MNNDNVNNDKDTCQQMFAFAELSSNQHNDRRQLTFRIAIGYTTLLALALYQTIKEGGGDIFPENFSLGFSEAYILSILIGLLTIGYCVALHVLHVASNNDVRRRDFYLKKAECIAHHISQNKNSPFTPDSDEKYIIINLGASKNEGPVTECELFEMKQPDIFIPSMKRGTPMRKIDFHYFSLIALLTLLSILLILNWLGEVKEGETRTVLDWIIVITVCLVAIGWVSVAIWCFIDKHRCRKNRKTAQ